jgi:hypothetical protein
MAHMMPVWRHENFKLLKTLIMENVPKKIIPIRGAQARNTNTFADATQTWGSAMNLSE